MVEILGIDRYVSDNPKPGKRFTVNSHEIYARVLIKHFRCADKWLGYAAF